MKSPKKPTHESSLPSQDESRRANVLMEQMISKFDAFGESLAVVRDRVDRIEPVVHELRGDAQVLKAIARTQGEDIRTIKFDVATLKMDVAEIKTELKGHNHRLRAIESLARSPAL